MQLHSKASLPVSFMYTYSYVTHPLHVTERGSANDTNNLHFTYNVYVCNDRRWLWNFKELDLWSSQIHLMVCCCCCFFFMIVSPYVASLHVML